MTQLRPGLHVVRRDDRHLQVGLDPPWRLVVPDEPEVRRLLTDLESGRLPVPSTPAAHRALAGLLAADMLVEPPVAHDRRTVSVTLSGAEAAAAEATRLLRAAGCATGPEQDAAVALLLCDGEPSRGLLDAHHRAGRPHLVVIRTAAGWTLGPFVQPDVTACMRCVDAHRGELDPRRAVVLEQLAGLPGGTTDPTLQALVIAWAVRDVLTYVDGHRPSTWSASIDVGPELEPRRREWTRHPHCGCSWDLTRAPEANAFTDQAVSRD